MTLLGLRDTCYNNFNFDIDEKDFYLGTDTYKKIDKILKNAQDEQLLIQFEEGPHLYQDYDPEYLSVDQKREVQHDIHAARDFLLKLTQLLFGKEEKMNISYSHILFTALKELKSKFHRISMLMIKNFVMQWSVCLII